MVVHVFEPSVSVLQRPTSASVSFIIRKYFETYAGLRAVESAGGRACSAVERCPLPAHTGTPTVYSYCCCSVSLAVIGMISEGIAH